VFHCKSKQKNGTLQPVQWLEAIVDPKDDELKLSSIYAQNILLG
jgi:hypothetical protein